MTQEQADTQIKQSICPKCGQPNSCQNVLKTQEAVAKAAASKTPYIQPNPSEVGDSKSVDSKDSATCKGEHEARASNFNCWCMSVTLTPSQRASIAQYGNEASCLCSACISAIIQ